MLNGEKTIKNRQSRVKQRKRRILQKCLLSTVPVLLLALPLEAQQPCNGLENCLAVLKSNNSSTQAGAIFILGNLKDKRAVPKLHEILETNSNREIQLSVIRALGSIGDEASVPLLSKMLKKESLQTETVKALVKIGGQAGIQALVTALKDHNVQLAVVQGLGEIADPAAKPHLISLYQSTTDERIRGVTAMAIQRIQAIWGPTEKEMGLPIYPGSEFIPNARAEWIFSTQDSLSKVTSYYQQQLKRPPLSFEAFKNKHESGFGESKQASPPDKPEFIFVVEEQHFQGKSYPSKLIFLKNISRETEIRIFDAIGGGEK